jgi:glycosyltransferase involved in cell wall biosynthesis
MVNGEGVVPEITVIIPVYNCKKYIHRCVESILSQSIRDIEIILVDDASEDGSYEMCIEMGKSDDRIRVIRQKHGGAAAARNRGMDEACGKYITFVDADDYIMSDMLFRLCQKADRSAADICISGYSFMADGETDKSVEFKETTEYCVNRQHYIAEHLKEDMLTSVAYTQCAKLYSRSFIEREYIREYDKYAMCEDAIFSMNCISKAEVICGIKYSGYCYCQHIGESLSKKYVPDAFEANGKLYEVISGTGLKDVAWLNAHFMKRYIGLMIRVYSMARLNEKERADEIRRLCTDDTYCSVLDAKWNIRDIEGRSFQLAAWLLRHRYVGVFEFLCKIKYH